MFNILFSILRSWWTGNPSIVTIERMWVPDQVASFRVYFKGMLKDVVDHPRIDFTPQAMKELLLDDGFNNEIVVIKDSKIVRES